MLFLRQLRMSLLKLELRAARLLSQGRGNWVIGGQEEEDRLRRVGVHTKRAPSVVMTVLFARYSSRIWRKTCCCAVQGLLGSLMVESLMSWGDGNFRRGPTLRARVHGFAESDGCRAPGSIVASNDCLCSPRLPFVLWRVLIYQLLARKWSLYGSPDGLVLQFLILTHHPSPLSVT